MKIEVIKGDITTISADAIVNAANSSLLGGGGVDGAIHRKGGQAILAECIKIRERQGGCQTGEAVITTAGNLPAKYVIHTVGPFWNGKPENDERLSSCYEKSLELAVENGLKTIAFPNISTGIYCFPKAEAAKIAIQTVRSFNQAKAIDKVVFVCFDEDNFALYEKELSDLT